MSGQTPFFLPARRDDPDDAVREKLSRLFDAAGFAECFRPGDLVAVKLHVGEPGTKTFVEPRIVRVLVDLVKAAGGRPFLTDTAVLYRSPRDNGPGHIGVAHAHGFTPEAVGAPFLPADGLIGDDATEVPVAGKHYEAVSIASAILKARSLLLVTHATGHLGTGFGGALKNLGMGCSSKKAKLRQHHGQNPRIDPDRCRACGVCAEWCPTGSIEVGETARIADATCIGCGECIAVCLEGAVRFDWAKMGPELCERIVEHAAAVIRDKRGRLACVTVATGITKNCDCLGLAEEPVVEDLGFFASRDPVAIDRAVLEMVRERAGTSLESLTYPDRVPWVQIEYAERMLAPLAVFDLDGTLLRSDGSFHDDDLAALADLGARGVRRAIASGRSPFSYLRAMGGRTPPVDFLVLSSGAVVLDARTGDLLRKTELDPADAARAAAVLEAEGVDYMVHEPPPENHRFAWRSFGSTNPDFLRRIALYPDHARELPPGAGAAGPATQLLGIVPPDRAAGAVERVRAALPGLSVIRTTSPIDRESTWIEIFAPGVSKSGAVAWLAGRHGIPAADCLAVGNDFNDLDLLRWAGTALVVANAPAEMRGEFPSVADHDRGGVAEAVGLWLRPRR